MTSENIGKTGEAGIRQQMDTWLKAVLSLDTDGVMSHYAPDVRAFDAIAQLQFQGADAYRKHWEACLSMCPPGQMIFEIHDPQIIADHSVGFCHSLIRCGGMDNGEEKTAWMRMTACYRKLNGTWKVAHEHFSMPFDMESGKVLELQP